MTRDCARTEVLAGAIALGEASDAERDAYRRHVATCGRCLDSYGGEREIERVMSAVAQARDCETWEPDLRSALRRGSVARRRAWRFGLSGLTVALALSIGIHAFMAANVPRQSAAESAPVTVANAPFHVTVENRTIEPRHPAAPEHTTARTPVGGLAVDRTVATLHPAQVASNPAPKSAAKALPPSSSTQSSTDVAASGVAAPNDGLATKPSTHDEGTIDSMRTAQAPTPLVGHAEAMQVVPNAIVVRDVMPIGGANAINPRPSTIYVEEGAEGTTAFEVTVDDKGTALRCTVTMGSGYLVLDDAVCKAAMHVRYSPRTVNGRPVASVYNGAITFSRSPNSPP